MTNRRFITIAVVMCLLALVAGALLGTMAAQIHDAQTMRYALEATFEAQFGGN